MPRYTIILYRDARQRYEVEIDADTPQAALQIARQEDRPWNDRGVSTDDNADMTCEI